RLTLPPIDRYLQKKRSAEHDITDNSFKFNDCSKDVHRDVPSINIILRSDCTIESNRYNCSQRETIQDKNNKLLPKNEDSERTLQTDLESSLQRTVQKKKDAVTFIQVDVETKYTNTLARSKLGLIENSSKPTSHRLTHSCICPLKLPNTNKNLIEHKVPSDTKTSYNKPISEDKQFKDSSGGQRMNFCTNINYNSTDYPLRNIEREIEDGNDTIEENSVDNGTTNSYLKPRENVYHSKLERKPKSTVLKGLSFENIPHSTLGNNLSVAKSADICTNANCNSIANATLKTNRKVEHENAIKDEKSVITMDNYSEDRKSVNRNTEPKSERPVVTVDTTLDMLQSILEVVKDANNKTMVKCKNIKCNYKNDMQNVNNVKSEIIDNDYETLPSMELMKPECMRMLTDIKERTKMLEEQLTVLNKDINMKKRVNEKCMAISERRIGPTTNIQDIYSIKQQRDIITQQPEKENVFIQESSSQNDIRHLKCVQENRKLELKNIVKLGKVKKHNLMSQQIDKRKTRNQQINVANKNDREQQENKNELLKCNNVNNLKRIENVQDIRMWSASSSILDHSNFKPLTSSTPTKMNLGSNKECSTQTNTRSERDSQMKQFKKSTLNESMTDSLKREGAAINLTNANNANQNSSNCQEKTIIMMLLTRGVSNTHLKSRYKKLKFINFRPTCIIDSCIVRDRISMKSKLPKRKIQIPTVFRELKSVVCKVEDRVDSEKPTCDDSMAKDGKVSDLLATVYTQSSNLYITTATSVSRVTFNNNNNNNNNNYTRDRGVRTGICTLS
ncbi:MATH and LRR domain-containing protein PFE0570w-like, partial [Hylaeus volcanicus]|uniref:MATH and LRR domain-containing protein PFE0570w-like n=1 Tax=Hylaeus volcanicus TaxID=313075 RepID=UPI0023B796C3